MSNTLPWRTSLTRLSVLVSLALSAAALVYACFDQTTSAEAGWNISLLLTGVAAACYFSARAFADPPQVARGMWALSLPAIFVGFQLLPLPLPIVKLLSPERAKLVESLAPIMHPPALAPISIHAATTASFFLRTLTYGITALLICEVCRYSWRRKSWTVAFPLIGLAAAEACLGIIQFANGTEVEGTYRSKDHFAGLLEMVLPLAVAYGISRLRDSDGARGISTSRALQAGIAFACAAAILTGLIYSLSKTGFAAGIGALFVMGTIAVIFTFNGIKRWFGIGVLGVSAAMMFAFLPTHELASAYVSVLSNNPSSIEGRAPIWNDSRQLLSNYPLVGTGLGTFETAFLKYQTSNLDWDFAFAHNDYLQLASELGVVGFLIFGGLFAAVLRRTIRATHSEDWNIRLLGVGCTGALAAIGIHSLADFNLYIPANALLLSWIVGMSMSLPKASYSSQSSSNAVEEGLVKRPNVLKRVARSTAPIFLGTVLILCAIVGLVTNAGNPTAESALCRLGLCDTGTVLAAGTGPNRVVAPLTRLGEAVKTDPAAPERWCDLGDAFLQLGQVGQAHYCYSRALNLGPEIPPILFRAAKFYHAVRHDYASLKQGSFVLEKSNVYQTAVLDWYRDQKFTVSDILCRGLPPGPRALQSYLYYWIGLGDLANAQTTWNWALSHNLADVSAARDYVNFVFGKGNYEEAAMAWGNFLGDRKRGYRQSDWIFNGDFEMEPSGVPFDWNLGSPNEQVDTALDSNVSHSGKHSLRIRFLGIENVDYAGAIQKTSVPSGTYHFTAFIRTQDITTDRGIAFRVFDPENSSRLDTKTKEFLGSTDWTRVEASLRVPRETKLLEIQVIRQPTLKFDNKVSGTAWIDGVSLSRME
jgi:O-antigen ligase